MPEGDASCVQCAPVFLHWASPLCPQFSASALRTLPRRHVLRISQALLRYFLIDSMTCCVSDIICDADCADSSSCVILLSVHVSYFRRNKSLVLLLCPLWRKWSMNLWGCELPSSHLLLACKEWMEILFLLLVFACHYRNSCIQPLPMHLRLLNISLFVNSLHSLFAVPLSACSGHLYFVILQCEVRQLQMFACFWGQGFAS